MSQYALIGPDNVVQQVVQWDGETIWEPPAGLMAAPGIGANIGDIYDPAAQTYRRPPVVAPVIPLEELRARLLSLVDTAAEAQRIKLLTPGSGMVMVYQEKFAEAQGAFGLGETAANALSADDAKRQFPILAASLGIEAPTLYACAQLVLQRFAAFAAAGYAIEKIRLTAKQQIKAATSQAQAQAAFDAIAWTT